MEPERRRLESYTVGLTEEQICEKDALMRSAERQHPDVGLWFREMCVDFCVRNKTESERIAISGEWEGPTKYSAKEIAKNIM